MNKFLSNCPLCEERSLHVLTDENETIDNQQCINCGYVTSHLFKLDGNKKQDNEKYKTLTEDMKNWSVVTNDRIWIPTIMTLPSGMLYPLDVDGKMKWGFAEMVDIPEEEQKNYPIPDQVGMFYKQKYDTDNIKTYDEFLYALAELNEKLKEETEDEI